MAVLWYAQAALQSDRSQSFFVCLFVCSVVLSGRWLGLGNPQEGPLSQSDVMTQMLWGFFGCQTSFLTPPSTLVVNVAPTRSVTCFKANAVGISVVLINLNCTHLSLQANTLKVWVCFPFRPTTARLTDSVEAKRLGETRQAVVRCPH